MQGQLTAAPPAVRGTGSRDHARAPLFDATGSSELFDEDEAAAVVRVDVPLEFGELVAAAYEHWCPEDLDVPDEKVRDLITAAALCRGLTGLYEDAEAIRRAEMAGTVDAPEWLARCRQRVREAFGGQAVAAPSPSKVVEIRWQDLYRLEDTVTDITDIIDCVDCGLSPSPCEKHQDTVRWLAVGLGAAPQSSTDVQVKLVGLPE